MAEISARVMIVGGGPGGYVTAIRAGQLGLDVVLVEQGGREGGLGGTCLNVGCIPSKAIIHAADAVHHAHQQASAASPFGLKVERPTLDFARTIEWKDGIVGRLTSGVGALLKRYKVKIVHGHATMVDGKTCRVDTDTDRVEVDGVPIGVKPGLVYYLLNKPAGTVTTSNDTHGRPTVVELVPAEPRVYPVGRLDMETEGLLLLTNDGELAQRLTHPSHGVEKEYLAEVAGGNVAQGKLRRLREGVELDDGITAPAKVSQPSPGVLRLTIHEGRNRQVRRMCEAIGHPVERLVRVRIGTLRDASLRPGEWRALTPGEVKTLASQLR